MALSFAPKGWLACNGQSMSIPQNTALFSLLGTMYGGDGRTTFNLPDLRGRTYVGTGQGQGLTQYQPGMQTGAESETLQLGEMPAHTHTLTPTTIPVSSGTAGQTTPAYYAATSASEYDFDASTTVQMAGDVLTGTASAVGGNQPHENRMPVLALQYCIATQGIFPSRP